MSYATGRTYCDADSHLMETPDWLVRYADPPLRDRLQPLSLGKGGGTPEQKIADAIARVKDPLATEKIARDVICGPKGWGAYGAFTGSERSKALDDLGFSRQLVFTTFAATQFIWCDDPNVVYGGLRAHNRAIVDFCSADKRLIPVGMVSLDDPDRAIAEIDEAIRLKVGAFWVPAAPAGEKSPGHPDFDPIWRRLSEAAIPFVLHIGLGTRVLPPAYQANGKPVPKDIHGGGENIRVKDYMVLSFAPQMFLAAMVFDGVFDRFPSCAAVPSSSVRVGCRTSWCGSSGEPASSPRPIPISALSRFSRRSTFDASSSSRPSPAKTLASWSKKRGRSFSCFRATIRTPKGPRIQSGASKRLFLA